MSQQAVPAAPFRGINTDAAPQSVWDRITTWASENKAVVYTVAGVTLVVTGAGVIYYTSSANKTAAADARPVSKKERRKQKREKDLEAAKSPTAKSAPEGAQPPSLRAPWLLTPPSRQD